MKAEYKPDVSSLFIEFDSILEHVIEDLFV